MRSLREFLGQRVRVTVDRPVGSRHPTWGFYYRLNYGFVAGTRAADGEPIDAYVLGVERPLEEFDGLCIAVIEREDDVEDKLIVAASGTGWDEAAIRAETRFVEQYFESGIVVAESQGLSDGRE